MTQPNWETVETPQGGNFIGWGQQIGQYVVGRVLDYDTTGGTDSNGNVVPQVVIELTDTAASFRADGTRTDFPAGEVVTITCSQANLKRGIRVADPGPGDLLKITLSNLYKAAKGTGKEFSLQIARGAGGRPAQPAAQPFQQASAPAAQANPFAAAAPAAQAAPPF